MRHKIIEDIYTQKKSDNENESAVASWKKLDYKYHYIIIINFKIY